MTTSHALQRAASLLLLACASSEPGAQPVVPAGAPLLVIEHSAPISTERPQSPQVEPHLSAHPTDPNLLFGAIATFATPPTPGGLRSSQALGLRSTDGGRTWIAQALADCRLDVWTAFAGPRDLYVACLGQGGPMTLLHSPDAGATWDPPRAVPLGPDSGADRPVLAGNPDGSVLLALGATIEAPGLRQRTYSPVAVRVEARGRDFGRPVPVLHDNLTQQSIDAVTLASGEQAVLFMDFMTSDDLLLGHRRTWMTKTRDGGRTFSLPALVFEQTRREMPWAAAVDRSAAHPGRLYVAVDGDWKRREMVIPDGDPPAEKPLYLLTSDDEGLTWKASPSALDPGLRSQAATPSVAVNRDGVVLLTWYDARNDPSGSCFDLYATASLDGGATFLPNLRMSTQTSCPAKSEKQAGVARRWEQGGDYSGLAASADGKFHVLWADSRSGIYQPWGAVLRVER